jgi:hypothetical protein
MLMNDVTESEAIRLLGNLSCCDGCTSWTSDAHLSDHVIQSGLTDSQGNKTGLVLELRCRSDDATKERSYLFTVFHNTPYGTERVYQLAVNQSRRQPRDVHHRSHEHFGGVRTMGTLDWARWSYAEVLGYFSSRTNIVFRPSPPEPSWPKRRKR